MKTNRSGMQRLLAIVCLVGMAACSEEFKSSIPEVSFAFSCDLVQAEYSNLKIPGQFVKRTKNVNGLPVGYAGLIIGQSIYSDGSTFIAYDAACPVEASRTVSVDLIDDGLGVAVCPSCHTKYNLSNNGYPEGQGTEYLKHYNPILSGTRLMVRN